MRRREQSQVHSVTGVRQSLTDDIRGRQRRYAMSMAIRTACFLAAIATDGVLRWVLFTAALILPYIAVVLANGGREGAKDAPRPLVLPTRTQLPPLRHEDRS